MCIERIKRVSLIGLLLVCFASSLIACDSYQQDIEFARGLEKQGRLDLALREYRRLELNYEARPEIQAGQGRIFSTRRATVFAGEHKLRLALEAQRDRQVWWNLVQLYIAMGWYNRARLLVQEPYLNLDELFDPETARLRDGLKCLSDPGRYTRYRLEQTPEHLERDYFLGLCLLIDQPQQKEIEQALELYEKIKASDVHLACRMVNVWPLAAQPAVDFRSSELKACIQKFKGDVAILREPMQIPVRDEDAYPIDRQLFHLDRFYPGDPGRSDQPQWPAPRLP